MTLPSGLPERVEDDENLARFLTSSSHFNSKGVRHQAFLPRPGTSATSVYRHEREPLADLWQIADDELKVHRTYGAAFVKAKSLREVLLDVVAAEKPPRHANIVGWPLDNDPREQVAKQKVVAISIAQNAEMVSRPQI